MITDATLTGEEVLHRFVVIKTHTCGIL